MVSDVHSDNLESAMDHHSLNSIREQRPLLSDDTDDGNPDEVDDRYRRTSPTHNMTNYIKRKTIKLSSIAQQIFPKNGPNRLQTTRAHGHPTTADRRLIHQILFLVVWFLINSVLIRQSWLVSSLTEPGQFLQPREPEWLRCVGSFWLKDDGCGLNGRDCPQDRNLSVAFRCPSNCGTSTGLRNPRVVGGQIANYQPLVVGGAGEGRRYRADSFVCQSAVHAGVISTRWGGCGVLKMLNRADDFTGSEANGIRSIDFPAPFPTSFVFLEDVYSSGCNDLRLVTIFFNVLSSVIFTIALGPSPKIFFWVLSFVGYWTVVVASEPRSLPPSWSESIGDFFPFLFVCYWLWNVSWTNTLQHISGHWAWVYLGPWWFGVTMNLTAGWVPLDRLTPHDIQQRPGALLALLILMSITLVLVCYQAWCLKQEKRFQKLRLPYILLGFVLVVLMFVPEHSVRIHHYLIGIFLSPLASARTNLSGVLQGFLLGMIQNGIARWSFASILERTSEVLGDGYSSEDVMPSFDLGNSGLINDFKDLKVSWKVEAEGKSTDPTLMVGVMVNDILSFIIPHINQSLIINNYLTNLTLSAVPTLSVPQLSTTINQFFFRLAFFKNVDDQRTSEYTGPITFFVNNQTWLGPIPVI
ncbi:hypothetical protein MJO29_005093 [Puccinia striiformis f. sp. tritici]|uniref:hypothetical protein n=1 Tax=Puccinia striiformis f. sp. tritici TaxID=168172 RepID=UPI002008AD49|nr:hypothetical protein Pst134EA_009214 [Puccinia striiformis f. sp. tritici]KAH9468678.1 hypothetical protein Pst134EA_009214 [Puccinia striiformis f. sp. tritici]KAI7960025.1 hypothetical protein MJO29_005093 [Puccinia striiformis f. sp. tritici]